MNTSLSSTVASGSRLGTAPGLLVNLNPLGANCRRHPHTSLRQTLTPPLLRPVHTASSNGNTSSLPSLVEQLLNTPGLEAPEGSTPQQMLKVTENFWKAMKDPKIASKPGPVVVTESSEHLLHGDESVEFDVCVAGGTLGVFLALALQRLGHRVCVIERRLLQGRAQEWNISDKELESLVKAGLLTREELQECIDTAWEADRVGFYSGHNNNENTCTTPSLNNTNDLWVKDVLNIGVSPRKLISLFKRKFLDAGGVLREHTTFKSATIYKDCALVKVLPCGGGDSELLELTPADVNRPCAVTSSRRGDSSSSSTDNECILSTPASSTNIREVKCRMLIDCMGHYSPIVKQIRNGQQPDGMVVVVGGCFTAASTTSSTPTATLTPTSTTKVVSNNNTADLLYSFTDSFNDSQLFWEAFPAEGGAARTAYMFLYSDTHPDRPTFASLLNTYLELLPRYQDISLDAITFKRVLFGGFPCYMHGSPLKPAFNRVLQVGDAAATQSPLSFGGFGAMVRHLPRFTRGIDQALTENKLSKGYLGWLQPYQPSLSVAWLFQRSMSLRVGQLQKQKHRQQEKGEEVNNKAGIKTAGDNGTTNEGWIPANHINRLLRCNFSVMRFFGDRVLRPFLQDSLQAGPLALTMLGMMLRDPFTVTRVLFQTGPMLILGWFGHFFSLVAASVLFVLLKPLKAVIKNYTFQRFLDALEYGTASDYEYQASSSVTEEDIAGMNNIKLKKSGVHGHGDSSSSGGCSLHDGNKTREVEQHPWPAAVSS